MLLRLVCIAVTVAWVGMCGAADKNKEIPDGYAVIHDGSSNSQNVVFIFRDESGKAWPIYFDGATENPVSFVYHKSGPTCEFIAKPETLSLQNGDQSRKILGELISHETVTWQKKGETRSKEVATWSEISAKIVAAGALEERKTEVEKKGKMRTVTETFMPTDVTLTINGHNIKVRAETHLRTSARDGKIGAINWRTTGQFSAKQIDLKVFPDATIEFEIATSLYPPREKGKKKKK